MPESSKIHLCDTPLYEFIETEWMKFDSKLGSAVTVGEEDVLLYLLWTLDSIKASAPGGEFLKSLWDKVRHAIRNHLIDGSITADIQVIDYISEVIIAFALYCFGLLLSGSSENKEIYEQLVHNLGIHWPNVRGIKTKLTLTNSRPLKDWLIDYFSNKNKFYTVSATMAWNDEYSDEIPDTPSRPTPKGISAHTSDVETDESNLNPESECSSSPLRLSNKIGKADFVRIVNALAEHGVFAKKGTSVTATKQQVIIAFAKLIGDSDFPTDFYNSLNSAKNSSIETNTKIFNTLITVTENFFNR